jgi:hypothetical protein
MKLKQQVLVRKKKSPLMRKRVESQASKEFWHQLQVLTRKHVSKIGGFRIWGQFNVGLNSLLKMEFPNVKGYMKRTQREINRFFIRKNRLSHNQTPRKIDISARFIT